MWPVGIVFIDVFADGFAQPTRAFEFIYVNQIVFQRPEKTLCTDIIKRLAFAIHGSFHLILVKQAKIFGVGEMAALIAVDDLRIMAAQCSFQTVHYEGLFQGTGKLKIDDSPAVPVDDDEQIHESFGHPDICNIDAPNLIRLRDGKVS